MKRPEIPINDSPKTKWRESAEKQAIRAACEKRGVLGCKGEKYSTTGKHRVRKIHQNIGTFRNLFSLGLEEL